MCGVVLLLEGGAAMWSGDAVTTARALALSLAIGGAALVVGFLTPIACALAAIGGAAMVYDATAFGVLTRADGPLAGALLIAIAVATACLGPGAFSLDAWLFGRREVLIRR
jgi:uncharacterized membrane protein YphA (DoxX/SURF4 family)